LRASRKNVYGRIPADIEGNKWERSFADMLDDEPLVIWWYRNLPRKAYSVGIPIAGYSPKGNNFFPDFIVGVRGRTKGESGILLVEIKGEYNNAKKDALEKAQSVHPAYGNVLMLHWEKEQVWRVVEYNELRGVNELTDVFGAPLLQSF